MEKRKKKYVYRKTCAASVDEQVCVCVCVYVWGILIVLRN